MKWDAEGGAVEWQQNSISLPAFSGGPHEGKERNLSPVKLCYFQIIQNTHCCCAVVVECTFITLDLHFQVTLTGHFSKCMSSVASQMQYKSITSGCCRCPYS